MMAPLIIAFVCLYVIVCHINVLMSKLTHPHTEHEKAEVVDLSVCHLDKHGEQVTLFKTQFAYVMDEKQYITQLLQSLSKPGTSPSSLFPPLPTADALREYDRSLTEALKSTELPSGWSLVSHNSERSITSVEGTELYICMSK